MTSTVNLKDSVALKVTQRKWGNRKQVKLDKTELGQAIVASKNDTDEDDGKVADLEMISMTKKLMIAKELSDVTNHMQRTVDWLYQRSVPIFNHVGVRRFSVSAVEEVEAYLEQAAIERNQLKRKLADVFELRAEEAKASLRGQWSADDYPSRSYILNSFNIEADWTGFIVPDNLPEIARARQLKKEADLNEQEFFEIRLALREGFKVLLDEATEVLLPGPDGKRKKLFDSRIEQIQEFIDTFSRYRDFTDDVELRSVLEEARRILTTIGDIEILKKSPTVKDIAGARFKEIAENLATMIQEVPRRKLGF